MNKPLEELTSHDSDWVPTPGAILFACGVIFLGFAILVGAAYGLTHSRGYELAPVFLQRLLRP